MTPANEKIRMTNGNGKLKIVAVSDHFLTSQFYLDCFEKFDDLEVIDIPYFGSKTRPEMRVIVDKIEREGAYAVPPPKEAYEAIKDADILMVHLCPVPRDLLEAAPNLKYILTNRGGLENIDVKAAHDLGIPIINNPAHNGNAVAELAICLMIAETRNVSRAHASLMNGVWKEDYPNFGQVYELRNKTVGIVGFGTIGRLVAEKLQPFRVKILTADPAVTADDPDLAKYNVTLTDLDTLLSTADIVTLHARTDKVRIIDKHELDLLKPTAYLINTARAYLVNYDYLAEILAEHRIMGAAIEVFPVEPLPADYPFLKLDNVTLTNHRGGDTVNCYSDSPEMLLLYLRDLLVNGKKPRFYIE
jgi:D-3-phosphoglycerate dehydrogenase